MAATLDERSYVTLRDRILTWGLTVAIGPAMAGGYVLLTVLNMPWDWVQSGGTLAVAIIIFGFFLPRVISGAILKDALADNPGDQPGARLKRLLEVPRRIELYSSGTAWIGGGSFFAIVISVLNHKGVEVIGLAIVVATALALLLGIPTVLLNERLLREVVLAEFHRHPAAQVSGSGLLWPRKRWYLPYVFAVMVLGLLLFIGAVVGTKYQLFIDGYAQSVGGADSAQGRAFLQASSQALTGMLVPVAIITTALLGTFILGALLLARRDSDGALAIKDSLSSLALGTPQLPNFVTTDEVGDVAMVAALVSSELRTLFARLRALAQGDLSVELTGDSGLAVSFKESQLALLNVTEQMLRLSRGEVIARSEVKGDVGAAFDQLATALMEVIAQARVIGDGDLREEVKVKGALGLALDRMVANLRKAVGELQRTGARQSEIVVSLRATASQLSSAATEQVTALTETANTMTEMSQTSAVSADRAAELIKQGNAASEVVDQGRKGARGATEAMATIQSSLSRVAAASTALAERVQRIDSIVETVGFLADQSSTLAINAGIEASRAGDAGRGFAAVAREMRSLAGDSRKATTQIRDILSELRQKTAQVDSQVAEGTETVEAGSSQVTQLGSVVEQLGVVIHEAVALMRQVEGSARQHQAGVSQVSQALTSLQGASQSIRDGARLLSELSEQAHTMSQALKETAGAYQLPAGKA